MEEKIKLKDEDLKLKEIDQLHAATIEFSKKCFEIKKVFATIFVALSTFLIKFNGNKINYKTFLILTLIIIFFWVIDAESYYYQEKLRRSMREIMNEIRSARNLRISDGVGIPLSEERKENNMLFRSFINSSQLMYIVLISVILLFGIIFYIFKWMVSGKIV